MIDTTWRLPDHFCVTHSLEAARAQFETLSRDETPVSVAGRVMAIRPMGRVIFADIQDLGGQIQLLMHPKRMGIEAFESFKGLMRTGHIVGVCGTLMLTRSGEQTVMVTSYELLAKMGPPMPDKFHGIKNVETRIRQRYLDLIMNEDRRRVLRMRAAMLRHVRSFLEERGYLEVETPILQSSPCGASANPFATTHRALGIEIFMRISPETFLKQLVVGGMTHVFEMGKNFRNEGIDPSHLQEFTMLEWYTAYWSYRELIPFVQEFIQHILRQTTGGLSVDYQGKTFDFSGEWRRVNYVELVEDDCGINVLKYDTTEDLLAAIRAKNIDLGPVNPNIGLGGLIDKLYKQVSRPKLQQPTFLMHHPAVLIPLARLNDDDPRVIDSFQVLVNGWELVKGYSELADAQLQRALLMEQARQRESGDDEAMFVDEQFLQSLEYGLPPVAGAGLGIDRLFALMTDSSSLRDAVMFPMLR